MSSTTLIIPLPAFIRIRVTGDDRVQFLHNFCTNDIAGLAIDNCCEAFFTNVKARILAHGFVLAAEDHHEIWMLPGDEALLLNHLDRYVITEDVALKSLSADHSTVAVTGPNELFNTHRQQNQWADVSVGESTVRCLSLQWNQELIQFISVGVNNRDALVTTLTSREDAQASESLQEFERLRILERIPLIGQDLSDQHLAPEAARNSSAICYTKGCYLGQEPIARLDAMGQVNRVLAAVELGAEETDCDSAAPLTSYSDTESPAVGLTVVRAENITSGTVVVSTPSGQTISATISKPTSLTGD